MKLHKIPLLPFLEILQDLYDSGANYIDLSGKQNKTELRDVIQIAVKHEYMLNNEEELDSDDVTKIIGKVFSEDDINDLM